MSEKPQHPVYVSAVTDATEHEYIADDLPGGYVDFSQETARDAVKRYAADEIGVKPDDIIVHHALGEQNRSPDPDYEHVVPLLYAVGTDGSSPSRQPDNILSQPPDLPDPNLAAASRGRVTVDAIIQKGGEVVLVERSEEKDQYPGALVIPGGHMEYGETTSEAAKREAQEETGLIVEPVTFWDEHTRYIDDDRGGFVNATYLCAPDDGELEGGSDAAAADWYDLADVLNDDVEIGFGHEHILRRLHGTLPDQ